MRPVDEENGKVRVVEVEREDERPKDERAEDEWAEDERAKEEEEFGFKGPSLGKNSRP
ncbi:MAG TPA: hypothetical protein PKE31_01405 [Pseudomonadota bacterium]|nr:hypothetical protein [Pseudomonadota bacterium]